MAVNLKKGGYLPEVFKSVLISIVFTVVLTLIFTLIVYLCNLPNGCVKIVNQFIKFISLFLGVFISVSTCKGLLKGGVSGVISSILVLFLFALIGKVSLTFLSVLLESVFSLVVGAISGIIAVTIKK